MSSRLNWAVSRDIAVRTGAEKFQCWYNACRACRQYPGFFLLDAYIEGWMVYPTDTEVQVLEHGWIEKSDGSLIDPTIVLFEDRERPFDYFSGLSFSWPRVCEFPPDLSLPYARLLSNRKDGLGHPHYRDAYTAALSRAQEVSSELQLPVRICPRETWVLVAGKDGCVVYGYEG